MVASTLPKATSPFKVVAAWAYSGAKRLQCPHLEGKKEEEEEKKKENGSNKNKGFFFFWNKNPKIH